MIVGRLESPIEPLESEISAGTHISGLPDVIGRPHESDALDIKALLIATRSSQKKRRVCWI